MKGEKIAGIIICIALLFLVGPFGQLVDAIQGTIRSGILFIFTFAAFGVSSFLMARMIGKYDMKTKQIEPKAVLVPCVVFLMMYVMASAFR